MRIGPAHHQRRRVLHHALGDVGVEIEADDHRQVATDLPAQPFQQLLFLFEGFLEPLPEISVCRPPAGSSGCSRE